MSAAVNPMALPIIWCIGGLDTAGGAGLSADQRAAEAMGVHACPVAACLTAQHSRGVSMVQPVDTTMLDAQLLALAQDMPPVAIKTGLLGSAAAIHTVARWVDALRQGRADGLPALVVDPVLSASAGGAAFSDEAIVAAYRTHLLPRATVITPNRAEAAVLRPLEARFPAETWTDRRGTGVDVIYTLLHRLGLLPLALFLVSMILH